jgi:hypothetical protein
MDRHHEWLQEAMVVEQEVHSPKITIDLVNPPLKNHTHSKSLLLTGRLANKK